MHRIGVFDSGIGGLTVLRQLRRAFPQLDMVYLGDTARVPYGGRSVETITHYAEDDVRFLLRKDVEAIVIACGTVSSNSLDALREKFDMPIYGVIESAARLAASMTKTRSVGVIGTQATVKSGAYEAHIRAIDPGVHVVSRACPLFVPLVEEGWFSPEDAVVKGTVSRYLEPIKAAGVDTLILGCTHYPVLEDAVRRFMGESVTLINPGVAVAQAVKKYLEKADSANEGQNIGTHRFFVTDKPGSFKKTASVLLGEEIDDRKVEQVDLNSLC